jgi:hypothetical protein
MIAGMMIIMLSAGSTAIGELARANSDERETIHTVAENVTAIHSAETTAGVAANP